MDLLIGLHGLQARTARGTPRRMSETPSIRKLAPVLAALALLALAACSQAPLLGGKPEAGDKVVAKVGPEPIWASDVRREAVAQGAITEGEPLDVSSELFHRTLDELVDQKLLAGEASRQGLDRQPSVKRRLQAAHDKLLGDVLVEAVVDKAVNENAIRALYQEQQRLSQRSEEIKARQIVVATEPEAQAIKKLLAAGASFDQLAMQRSTDSATRFNGGDLGYFTLDAMPEAYGAVLKGAKPGETVGPIKIDAGYAILRVEDRRPEQPISLDEARPQIVRFLTYDEIRTLLQRLRSATRVQMLIPAPDPNEAKEPASAPRGSALPSGGDAPEGAPVPPAAAPSAAPASMKKKT
jgi:peptidyl-prolyl cis-trans isomerase C